MNLPILPRLGTDSPLIADRNLPLLTAEQERRASPDDLVRHNIRLALFVARRDVYQGRGVEREDLEQIACIGLITASRLWRNDIGVRFTSYAVTVIKSHLQRGIHNHGAAIRVPVWLQEKKAALRRTENELTQALGRQPTLDELAATLGWERYYVDALLQAEAESLDEAAGEMGRERYELVAGPDDTEEDALDCIAVQRILDAVDRLPPRWKAIFVDLHPLDGTAGRTMREVARTYGISHERVRQIQDKSRARIRAWLEGREPDDDCSDD